MFLPAYSRYCAHQYPFDLGLGVRCVALRRGRDPRGVYRYDYPWSLCEPGVSGNIGGIYPFDLTWRQIHAWYSNAHPLISLLVKLLGRLTSWENSNVQHQITEYGTHPCLLTHYLNGEVAQRALKRLSI